MIPETIGKLTSINNRLSRQMRLGSFSMSSGQSLKKFWRSLAEAVASWLLWLTPVMLSQDLTWTNIY